MVVEYRERLVEVVAAGDSRFLEQLHVPLNAIRAEMLAQRRKTYRVAAVAVRLGLIYDVARAAARGAEDAYPS